MGLKNELKKTVKKVVDAVKPHVDNVLKEKEYRAEECFKVFEKHNVQMISKQTGQDVTEWQDFGARIDRKRTGNYGLKFCLEEFAEKGFVPKGEYNTPAPLPTFDTSKCFTLFSEGKKVVSYNKWVTVTQELFEAACKDIQNPNAPFCEAFSSEFTGEYTLELCEAKFAEAGLLVESAHMDL